MNLNVNIIFVICLSKYLGIFANMRDEKLRYFVRQRPGKYDCYFPIPIYDHNMPLPFTMNTTGSYPKIIRPNRRGFLRRRHMENFNLACIGSYFITPKDFIGKKIKEIMVQCLNRSYIEHEGIDYDFEEFKCGKYPKAILKLTQERCQDKEHRIAEIGFQTIEFFLKLYSTCFHMETKNVLYSWYLVQGPIYEHRQASKDKWNFSEPILFGDVDPKLAYAYQDDTVGLVVNSTFFTTYFPITKIKGTRFLIAAPLTSKNAFTYAFEQHATYFYENTAPQWYIFNDEVWKHLEKILKRNMFHSNNKHVIITGTYGWCALPTEDMATDKPLFLLSNLTMSVPLYIWKLNYDLQKKDGMVYIGLNNPYKKVSNDTYMCEPTPCPGNLMKRIIDRKFLYCCTKESFERTYGKIDLTVYREIEFIY